MIKTKSLLIFVSIILITFSCTSFQKNIQPDLEKVTYKALLQHHALWQESVKSLNAEMRITLDSPQYSGNLMSKMLVSHPDSMLVTVSGPFGIHLGKVFVNESRFIFYNQIMDQFMMGSKQDFEGRNFLQFPVEIGQIKDIFTARDPFDVLEKKIFEARDQQYFIEAANGHYNYKIWFDPELLLIKRIEYLEGDSISFYKEYDKYVEVNGIYFPHIINFVKPDEKQGISIIITELEMNNVIDPNLYKIKISDSATQLDLNL